jgi:hypothetical protein
MCIIDLIDWLRAGNPLKRGSCYPALGYDLKTTYYILKLNHSLLLSGLLPDEAAYQIGHRCLCHLVSKTSDHCTPRTQHGLSNFVKRVQVCLKMTGQFRLRRGGRGLKWGNPFPHATTSLPRWYNSDFKLCRWTRYSTYFEIEMWDIRVGDSLVTLCPALLATRVLENPCNLPDKLITEPHRANHIIPRTLFDKRVSSTVHSTGPFVLYSIATRKLPFFYCRNAKCLFGLLNYRASFAIRADETTILDWSYVK